MSASLLVASITARAQCADNTPQRSKQITILDEQFTKFSTQQSSYSTFRFALLKECRKLRHSLGVYLLQLFYTFRSLRSRFPLFPVGLGVLLTIALSVPLLNEKRAIILHGRYMGIEGREADSPSQ